MGGDDLASDDEFLAGGVISDDDDAYKVTEATTKKGVRAASTVVLDDNSKKRKRPEKEGTTSGNDNSIDDKQAMGSSSRRNVLLKAARSIETESAQQQATFLWTALGHHHQLQQSGQDQGVTSNSNNTLSPVLQSFHFKTPNDPSTNDDFVSRFQAVVSSKKQMKQWKHVQSPMILVLCLSARRAVQVLKDIAPVFKTRALKLFAKHLTVAQQEQWLRSTANGLAVGTPHRMQVLAERGALSLKHTQLVVLDAHKDGKQFTVCTLPDTAPHVMQFLRDWVLPQLQQRPKEIKLAFC